MNIVKVSSVPIKEIGDQGCFSCTLEILNQKNKKTFGAINPSVNYKVKNYVCKSTSCFGKTWFGGSG
jgi:hypothetical protein